MTASTSPSELSLCQTRLALWPSTFLRMWTASCSRLVPGNWRTAKFIFVRSSAPGWSGAELRSAARAERRALPLLLRSGVLDLNKATVRSAARWGQRALPCLSSQNSFDGEVIIFDHRIAEELVARIVDLFLVG